MLLIHHLLTKFSQGALVAEVDCGAHSMKNVTIVVNS